MEGCARGEGTDRHGHLGSAVVFERLPFPFHDRLVKIRRRVSGRRVAGAGLVVRLARLTRRRGQRLGRDLRLATADVCARRYRVNPEPGSEMLVVPACRFRDREHSGLAKRARIGPGGCPRRGERDVSRPICVAVSTALVDQTRSRTLGS